MKTKLRIAAVLTAVLLAAALTASAVTDNLLSGIYDAGKRLLFDTHNVTLTGTADFSLDGVRFKTVNAKYIQDDTDSYWKYQLLTPQKDKDKDYESGFTVIANGWQLYTMDSYYPGTYREGFDTESDTLVRTSALMRQAVDLASIAVGALEPALGENALQVTASNQSGTTLRLMLDESNITDLTRAAFNACAQMAIRRAIVREDFDGVPLGSDLLYGGMTRTMSIIYQTQRYSLRALDVTVGLDSEGRLTALTGAVSVQLDPDPALVTDDAAQPQILDVTFDIAMSDYGTSEVGLFDPAAEGLVPEWQRYMEQEGPEEP